MTIDAAGVAAVLGGAETLGRKIETVGDLRRAVEDGLPVASLDLVIRRVIGDRAGASELRHRIVPKTTLQRRRRLTAGESQRLERLARLTALAEQVWEDASLAHEFLTSEQPQLDSERPVDLARSDLGARQVEELLLRLEYSIPV